jgi:HAD superfamily hydrolase (TIGR01509 family)
MLKALLCDRDGVIFDSEKANIESSQQTLIALGISPHVADQKIIMGRHPHDYVQEFVEKYGIVADDFLQLRTRIYQQILDDMPLNMDAIALIDLIRERLSIKIGLVTSANRDSTMRILAKNNLTKLFDIIVTFEDCAIRKPAPDPYITAAQKLNVAPRSCIVIEDSPVGALAAKRANMTCIVRRSDYTKNHLFPEADLVVDDLMHAKDFICDFKPITRV